jgi:hypothetical protein
MEMIPMLMSSVAGAAGAAGAAGGASTALSALSMGTSAVSALSMFGQARQAKLAASIDATSEHIAGMGSLIDAQQKSNDISANYNQTVADQLAVASAGGYDVSSGSVVAARAFAQTQAGRQLTVVQQGAQLQASLRRARAMGIIAQGDQQATADTIGGIGKLIGAGMNLAQLGGPSPSLASVGGPPGES